MKKFFLLIILVTLFPACILSSQHTASEGKELITEFQNLGWNGAGTYLLANSNSTLVLPEGHIILLGKKTDRARELLGLPYVKDSEAIILTAADNFETFIEIESMRGWHTDITNWSKLDSDLLLKAGQAANTKNNETRKLNGLGEVKVLGWKQKPSFDRMTNSVHFATEWVSKEEGQCVSEFAIKLGRDRALMVKWVHPAKYSSDELNILMHAHNFQPGSRYEDYRMTDQIYTWDIEAFLDKLCGGAQFKPEDTLHPPVSVPTIIILGLFWLSWLLAAFFTLKAWRKAIWSGNDRITSDMFWCFSLSILQQLTNKQLLTKEALETFSRSWTQIIMMFFIFFFWSWTQEYAKCRLATIIINILFTGCMIIFLIFFGLAALIMYNRPSFLTIFIALGLVIFLLIFMLIIIRKYTQIMVRNNDLKI